MRTNVPSPMYTGNSLLRSCRGTPTADHGGLSWRGSPMYYSAGNLTQLDWGTERERLAELEAPSV